MRDHPQCGLRPSLQRQDAVWKAIAQPQGPVTMRMRSDQDRKAAALAPASTTSRPSSLAAATQVTRGISMVVQALRTAAWTPSHLSDPALTNIPDLRAHGTPDQIRPDPIRRFEDGAAGRGSEPAMVVVVWLRCLESHPDHEGKEVECGCQQIGKKYTFVEDVFIEIDESEVIVKPAPPRKGQLIFVHRPSVGTWLQRVTVRPCIRPTATAAAPKRRRMSQAIGDKGLPGSAGSQGRGRV
ncbi:unnamed protein product [Symbiodinium microadriaticum]|nr:unnamed protein product [Symbiodinium microadriaticum]